MSAHKRVLRLACPCGRNLATVRWDDLGDDVILPEASGVTRETFYPGQGRRLVMGPDAAAAQARSVPHGLGEPTGHPDATSHTLRCRCGRVHAATGARARAWWLAANRTWENDHDPTAWRMLLTA